MTKPSILRRKLLAWFKRNKRSLPWREKRHPYHVWISEIMLQQTQVKTVIPYFRRFIKALPDIKKLADAPEESVLKLWEGLGYYRRARHIHTSAKTIKKKFNGVFPRDYQDILALQGVGTYTAAAIASIAFGEKKAVVDGNVRRVLARLHGLKQDVTDKKNAEQIGSWADALLTKKNPGEINEALMELGALVCTPGASPECLLCPWVKDCEAKKEGIQDHLPVGIKRQKIVAKRATSWVIVHPQRKRYLLRKRPNDGRMAGLWEFPTHDGSRLKAFKPADPQKLLELTHHYTRFKIRLTVKKWIPLDHGDTVLQALEKIWPQGKQSQWRWIGMRKARQLPFSTAQAKIRDFIRLSN